MELSDEESPMGDQTGDQTIQEIKNALKFSSGVNKRSLVLPFVVCCTITLPIIGILGIMSIASGVPVVGIAFPVLLALCCFGFTVYVFVKSPPDFIADFNYGARDTYPPPGQVDVEMPDVPGEEPIPRNVVGRANDYQTAAEAAVIIGNDFIDDTYTAPSPSKWQIQLGMMGGWNDFDEEVSFLMSEALASGQTLIRLDIQGREYELNLQEMTQKNPETGKTRQIRQLSGM